MGTIKVIGVVLSLSAEALSLFLFWPTENEISREIAIELDGKTEVVTPDGSRVDILTEEYAWEVEWCTKDKPYKHWQAPSQAVWYAACLNRKPGVILLVDGSRASKRGYMRCLFVCNQFRQPVRLEVRRMDE